MSAAEPLTPEEEARWRTYTLKPAAIDRIWATLDAAREQIETLRMVGRMTEAALQPSGDHHTLPDGYCLDCQGGCIVPLARENTEAIRKAAYAKPDPFGDAS